MPYYGVAKGRNTGSVSSWNECEREVSGSGASGYSGFGGGSRSSSSGYGCYGSQGGSRGESYCSGRSKGRFIVDSDGYLIVYTDGSCENNGRYGAKAGIGVYFNHDHPWNVSEPAIGRATNNSAELQAATRALELAKKAGFDKVKVRTDSQFLKDCFHSWMPHWKENGWKKANGDDVINREDLHWLDRAARGLSVKIEYVPGHSGDTGNEAADQLAREGAKRYN